MVWGQNLTIIFISIFQIDCYAVNEMTDEQLMKYEPKIGDRMAIRQYCRRGSTTGGMQKEVRDMRIEKRSHNSNAIKTERAFQMGLFEEVSDRHIQVKERRGGGTRHLKAPKTTTMAQLLDTGKELFPNGKSRLGDVSEFNFTIWDFTEEELDPMTTLGQQYKKRKVQTLRLYLSCIKK